MELVLYSTGCPQCNVLVKKLESKGIKYTKNGNVDDMRALGIDTVPVLAIGDNLLTFVDAIKWVNAQ